MALDVFYDEFQPSWEEEGLFARDLRGQLIRVVEAREEDYFKTVTVRIDGQAVIVPKATPATDAQGKIIYLDAAGRTQPRRTTIYDAALALCLNEVQSGFQDRDAVAEAVRQTQDLRTTLTTAAALATPEEQQRRETARAKLAGMIPSLCHLDHLRPVGVCRVCSVELAREEVDPKDPTKKTYRGSGKLVPACVQPVEDGMYVNTLASESGDRVRKAVKVLLELLAADHYVPSAQRKQCDSDFERLLVELNNKLSKPAGSSSPPSRWLNPKRFAPHKPWNAPIDSSSQLVLVNPNACILCDRCARACNEIKHNHVIGRTGKGYSARIGFDLNDPMGQSSCVECGECMLTCPTQALVFHEPVKKSDWFLEQVGGEAGSKRKRSREDFGKSAVGPSEMDQNDLLRSLPWRHREWNQYSVIRWRLRAGEMLCQAGDYGATAFLLQSGTFELLLPHLKAPVLLTRQDCILGEMTCLNYYPRNASVRAKTDADVFEIRRNVLFALQRVPESREKLMQIYRRRAILAFIRNAAWFQNVSESDRDAAREFLLAAWQRPAADASGVGRAPVDLVQLEPGQIIYREGELADAFYVIRIGHVKVSQSTGGVIRYLRPVSEFGDAPPGQRGPDVEPNFFGEIGCLADWPEAHDVLPPEVRDPRRTATCAALDHVELVRIDRDCFRALLSAIPALKAEVLKAAATRLEASTAPQIAPGAAPAAAPVRQLAPLRREFVEQGLYNSQRLLVLDLEACTRCDECTKACSDTHQGITRLIRDGARIDKWLVASSCRSCSDPYCLVGCPVDSIHRDGRGKQIRIESHCIGCGLCASNCPYGNINMHPRPKGEGLQWTPTTCDLCNSSQCSSPVGPDRWREVNCVFACPHNAAFRMTGDELWQNIEQAK